MMISNSCSKMIQKMKRQSKLNNAALRQLLVPALEHLDLSGVYITDSTLKLVWKNCPNLRVLSLKDCGYIVTDSIMEQLVKVKWEGDFSNIKAKHSHRCQLSLHQKFCLGLLTYKGLFKVCKLCPSNTKQKFWYWINYIHYEPNKENYIFITKTKNDMDSLSFPFQKLPHLESLSLCGCKHLTDRSARALSKYAQNLKELNLSWITTISETSIINLMTNCSQLVFLDIYDHTISQDSRIIIADIARERKMKIVLKDLTDHDIAPENPCSLLPNFGKVW